MHLDPTLVKVVLVPLALVIVNSLLAAAVAYKESPKRGLSLVGMLEVALKAAEGLVQAAENAVVPLVTAIGGNVIQDNASGLTSQVIFGVIVALEAALSKEAISAIKANWNELNKTPVADAA